MNKTPINRSHGSPANPQEPGVVKKQMTCESALREEGIDPVFVARRLRDLLDAKMPRWNPKNESWEKFEDYPTQLAALKETGKILGIYPAEKSAKDKLPVKVVLVGVPRPGHPIGDDEQSVGTAVRDGSERCER